MTQHEKYENKIREWIIWSEKNGRTPKRHSKDKNEAMFAARISSYVSRMRKNPNKYGDILKIYLSEYRRYENWDVEKYSDEEILKKWYVWFEEHQEVPKGSSDTLEERSLAMKFKKLLVKLKQDAVKNEKTLQKINAIKLQSILNKKRKVLLKNFIKWKAWIKQHGKLPCVHGNGENENQVATAMKQAIIRSEREGTNTDIIAEYKKIKESYKKHKK